MARTYTRTKTIDGVEYTAKFCGMRYALSLLDSTYVDGTTVHSNAKLTDRILNEVIVSPPGLNADSFDAMTTLQKVVSFGLEVAQGKFRDEQDTAAPAGI